jgi:hypothetical protein
MTLHKPITDRARWPLTVADFHHKGATRQGDFPPKSIHDGTRASPSTRLGGRSDGLEAPVALLQINQVRQVADVSVRRDDEIGVPPQLHEAIRLTLVEDELAFSVSAAGGDPHRLKLKAHALRLSSRCR